MRTNTRFARHLILVIALALLVLGGLPLAARAVGETTEGSRATEGYEPLSKAARPSTAGGLQVIGTQLCDNDGEPVVLRGVSTHGLQWYPQFVNDDLFAQLATDWNCNLVRLALYSKDYSDGNQEQNLEVLHAGIDACIAHDMYVLVDWHILEDNNPNENLEQAKAFFDLISREYAGVPNVIYEICNEPNGETTWTDVKAYAEQIIPIIRENSPRAIIIVGTSTFDRDLMNASRNPLEFDNIMYTLHFYAATHGNDLQGELLDALDSGLPVFVTECGISEASGDGRVDFNSAVSWFNILRDHQISYTIWSLSNKAETSAFIKPTSKGTTHLDDSDLTPVGAWVRPLIQGTDPSSIPLPALDADGQPIKSSPDWMDRLDGPGIRSAQAWPYLAAGSLAVALLAAALPAIAKRRPHGKATTYDEFVHATRTQAKGAPKLASPIVARVFIFLSTIFTLIYLAWRVRFSVPVESGWLAIAGNIVLLVVEGFGFVESVIHYDSISGICAHPLPKIAAEEYPDVDIFISTYNEPCDLLRRTINGCNHLRYPDKRKVHVWLCDDNRRPEMRALAKRMGVGYFDRPDNKGAKAGNLNHALALTSAPYIVTLDADMIVKSDFLLKTIPYFVDVEKRNAELPEDQQVHLGLLQTPQAFYDPDVFQHALYSETRTTNEQDYFYRTIEVARTGSNSVIYGGSNTIISREALEAVGGFYTESITEDFATGLLIESAGFVSLGLGEPLASGRTPHTFKEHIQQRTRWGRGVIVTARKLHLFTRPGLTFRQRISYWSSEAYWYSPIKNLIYICSPLLFAVFGLPVFSCSWLDLLVYWLPMYLAQSICLRVMSGNSISATWSGIHETSIMPHLLIPIIKESLGISLTTFKVTDKSGADQKRTVDWEAMRPFLVLLGLSVIGIARVCWLLSVTHSIGLFVLLFWLLRNSYYLIMALFLIDGRDSDGEVVHVIGAEPVMLRAMHRDGTQSTYEGVATYLTEHSARVYLDFAEDLALGESVRFIIDTGEYRAQLDGIVVGKPKLRSGNATVHTIEIVDYGTSELEYLQILYDRVPSLPQRLTNDYSTIEHLWRNIAFRIARTVR